MGGNPLSDGIGTDESQLDWTPWSVTEDVALDGTCSKRKRAFFKSALPRLLTFLERSARHAHPKPAPWHITTGVCTADEVVEHVMEMNWSGWWFRHMCRAADILKIPCPDQRFMDDQRPWNSWGEVIDLKLEHQIARPDGDGEELISRDWELPPFYLGNCFPRKKRMSANAEFPFQRHQLLSRSLLNKPAKEILSAFTSGPQPFGD